MARHSGYGRFATSMTRIAIQQAATQAREAERQRRAAERQYERDMREHEKQQKQWQKETARNYQLSRADEVAARNAALDKEVSRLQSLLADTVATPYQLKLSSLKISPEYPPFDAAGLDRPLVALILGAYLPPPLAGVEQHWPPAKRRYERDLSDAHARYNADLTSHALAEHERERRLAERRLSYIQMCRAIEARVAADNAPVDELQRALDAGESDAIAAYCTLTLRMHPTFAGWPEPVAEGKIVYVPESRQLVVEYTLPPFDAVPAVASYK